MYIAKAYVKIGKKNIGAIKSYLLQKGYEYQFSCRDTKEDTYIVIFNGKCFSLGAIVEDESTTYIDCNMYTPNGTEEEAIALFLELTKIGDEINPRTWVIWEENLVHSFLGVPIFAKGDIGQLLEFFECDEQLYRELTPLELAEAVKDGRITKEELINN